MKASLLVQVRTTDNTRTESGIRETGRAVSNGYDKKASSIIHVMGDGRQTLFAATSSSLSYIKSRGGSGTGSPLGMALLPTIGRMVSGFLLASSTSRRALGYQALRLHQRRHDGFFATSSQGHSTLLPTKSRRVMSMSTGGFTSDNVITSTGSKTVKKVQALLNKRKKRYEACQTIVEGPRMVFDLIDNPKTRGLVKQVLISTDQYDSEYMQRLENEPNIHVQLVEPVVFKACSDTVTPQGIVAVVDFPTSNKDSIIGGEGDPLFLILDGISDPGNMGTLIRSSLAAGVTAMILLPGCCDIWNPKTVRSAMGASFQIPILEFSDWDDTVEAISNEFGIKTVFAATMLEEDEETGREGSQAYFDIDWTQGPLGLIVGSEGNGLSDIVRKAVDDSTYNGITVKGVHIPMMEGIESLNAAVCGSVIAFEFARQRETVK